MLFKCFMQKAALIVDQGKRKASVFVAGVAALMMSGAASATTFSGGSSDTTLDNVSTDFLNALQTMITGSTGKVLSLIAFIA